LWVRLVAGAGLERDEDAPDEGHEVGDADVVTDGELTKTAEPFSQRFLMIMTVRDGQIVHSRDYTNPVTGAQLLGKLPQLLAALSGDQAG